LVVIKDTNTGKSSVAEPELELEPVEQQLFAGAGAGAKVFLARLQSSRAGCVNSHKMLQKP
jgi:hypothetical protein